MTDILPQTRPEDVFDLLAQSENMAVSHIVESEATSAVEPRQFIGPEVGKKRVIIQQVDLNSTRELSDPITNDLRSPQTANHQPDDNGLFDDLHAKIVENLRESHIQETRSQVSTQSKALPGPYITDGIFLSSYSHTGYAGLRHSLTPTATSTYLTRPALSEGYAKPVNMETTPKGFGHLLVKINSTLRASNPVKFAADDVKVSYRIPTEYTSNLSVRQNTEAWDDQKRVDQIVSRIVRTSSQKPASILRNSTQSIYIGSEYEKILPKNINQEVRFSVASERESVKKAAVSQVQQQRKGRTVTKNLQNDQDSMFMEKSVEKKIQEEEYAEEIAEERHERKVEKKVHKEEKPKKLTKRQEILNDKKSLRSSSQQIKSSEGKEEMRKSRVTLNNKPLERNFGTEFILSPKKISATHYKSFGSLRGKGNSYLAGRVFTDNV